MQHAPDMLRDQVTRRRFIRADTIRPRRPRTTVLRRPRFELLLRRCRLLRAYHRLRGGPSQPPGGRQAARLCAGEAWRAVVAAAGLALTLAYLIYLLQTAEGLLAFMAGLRADPPSVLAAGFDRAMIYYVGATVSLVLAAPKVAKLCVASLRRLATVLAAFSAASTGVSEACVRGADAIEHVLHPRDGKA